MTAADLLEMLHTLSGDELCREIKVWVPQQFGSVHGYSGGSTVSLANRLDLLTRGETLMLEGTIDKTR